VHLNIVALESGYKKEEERFNPMACLVKIDPKFEIVSNIAAN